EGLVAIVLERAQRPAQLIALRRIAQLNRLALKAIVERLAIEIAGALVERAGREVGNAWFVGRVLARAAAEGEIEGDQRHRGIADDPGFDPGRGYDALDLGGVRGQGGERHR